MFEDKSYKLFLGDCLDVMKDLPDESVDMVLTDAPYGINFCSSRTNRKEYIKNDDFDNWFILMQKVLIEWKRILTPTGVCCCCCGGGGKTPVTAYLTMEIIKHFNLIQTLVWKKFVGLGWKYRPSYENILVFSKSADNYNFYDTSNKCSNVIEGINQDIPRYNKYRQPDEHPTQKPIALMKHLLLIHSKENDIVIDSFMGGNSTGIACIQTNRLYIGIEINEGYFKIAEQRISNEFNQLKMF